MNDLPFAPHSEVLRDVLRKNYIKPVTQWLLGHDENAVLAQKTGSCWESALTILFLAEANDIFAEQDEELELRKQISSRSAEVARWLLTKKTNVKVGGIDLPSWEEVTWDTAVVIRALLTALKKYPHEFSAEKKKELLDSINKSTQWLSFRFSQWEKEVKYPFGPADIAQIVITIIFIRKHYPDLFSKIIAHSKADTALEIVKYLLHVKTDKTIQIQTVSGEKEDVVTCWWDDCFSTSEVIEALAHFHAFYDNDHKLKQDHQETLHTIKKVLVRACTYFDQGQADGMWGSHIDTLKVITAYVIIRPLLPSEDKYKSQNEDGALMTVQSLSQMRI